MTARRFRFYVVFAATLVVGWLVAFPAMASGPMCDDRAASAIAPSPTLVTAPDVLDIGESDSCDGLVLQQDRVHRGSESSARTVAPDDALLTSRVQLVPPIAIAPRPDVDTRAAARPGVRPRVERPPRG